MLVRNKLECQANYIQEIQLNCVAIDKSEIAARTLSLLLTLAQGFREYTFEDEQLESSRTRRSYNFEEKFNVFEDL